MSPVLCIQLPCETILATFAVPVTHSGRLVPEARAACGRRVEPGGGGAGPGPDNNGQDCGHGGRRARPPAPAHPRARAAGGAVRPGGGGNPAAGGHVLGMSRGPGFLSDDCVHVFPRMTSTSCYHSVHSLLVATEVRVWVLWHPNPAAPPGAGLAAELCGAAQRAPGPGCRAPGEPAGDPF